jgi:hypothetical protein
VRVHGDVAYVTGHGPFDGDRLLVTGRVRAEVSVEQAYDAAWATGLSMLASLEQVLGDLDRVTGWMKVLGFVKCADGFNLIARRPAGRPLTAPRGAGPARRPRRT